MSESTTNERLASLEAKLEFLKELLKEIRDDVKNLPTREEVEELKERCDKMDERQDKLEKAQTSLLVKVGIASGVLSFIIGIIVKIWMK